MTTPAEKWWRREPPEMELCTVTDGAGNPCIWPQMHVVNHLFSKREEPVNNAVITHSDYKAIVGQDGDREALMALYDATDGWHPDDPCHDIYTVPDGRPLFDADAAREADALIARLDRVGDDPIDILTEWMRRSCRCTHTRSEHEASVCRICDCDLFEGSTR